MLEYFLIRLVEFKSKVGAQKALEELHESELDGRKLYLKKVSKVSPYSTFNNFDTLLCK